MGRRNGRSVALFTPDWSERGPWQMRQSRQKNYLDDPKYFVNLSAIERATWRQILSAQSIASIAKEEGVSRSAIYSRIEGNRLGQGGMIGKNFWALLWWRLRHRIEGRIQ